MKTADLILTGGQFLTLTEARPVAEALALGEGKILAAGREEDLLALRGPETRVVGLAGATALPGLTDAHLHLRSLGQHLAQLDLRGTTSFAEVLGRTADWLARRPGGDWVIGRGWDQNDWLDPCLPDNRELNRLAAGVPVLLWRVDGHAVLASESALAAAGIGPATPDPEGGRIFRDPHSDRPTGLLLDNAAERVRQAVPEPAPREMEEIFRRSLAYCASLGLAGVHDAGVGPAELEALRSLARRGELPIRVYAMLEGTEEELCASWLASGPDVDGADRLIVRCLKFYADGALGSRGAALLEPYSDDPGNSGLLLTPPPELERRIADSAHAGFQVAVHAIGDRANRLVLDTLERAMTPEEIRHLRPRIEHAQILDPQDIPRFGRMGIIASLQPTHCPSDMPWAGLRLGPARLGGAYAWRSLLDSGCRLAGGSDAPVEPPDPLLGLQAAITRQDAAGQPPEGWMPAQRLSPLEALSLFTRGAAWASFAEAERGTLEADRQADLTILERNPLLVPAGEIPRLRVLATLVDGRPAWQAPGSPLELGR
jgi:predicted amidohydrolase YtcJ